MESLAQRLPAPQLRVFPLAKFRHSGNTAENMGHRNTDMLYKHYRDVIKDQGDVDAFWKLGPPTG
jgi:hypothetical protein